MSGWSAILHAAGVERARFALACTAPRAAQWELLRSILATNAACAFGRAHGFQHVNSLEAFRAQVPITDYEKMRPWLARVAAGEGAVLTTEPVIAFEETGGSSAGGKLIPYTAASLAAFRAAVLPWLADLAERRPGAVAGRAYVAVSPVTRAPRAIHGIPVGLASEGAYLGDELMSPFLDILAVPPQVARIADVARWRFVTLACLLAASDLSFISIWSPTFLIDLLAALPAHAEELTRAVHDGDLGGDLGLGADCAIAPDPARARVVERALSQHPIDTARLWPRLDTVSVWTDGAAQPYAHRLQAMLPHVQLQSKGLLATEGAVTLSYGCDWPVPALTSAFLELIDDAGGVHLCDELRPDESYRVVITTPGGLYRYDLGDRVRCHGYAGALPLLEFVGRHLVSDLVGEKLTEHFVGEVLRATGAIACLVPRATARPHYELLVDEPEPKDGLAEGVDERLRANPQYAYARTIGQLGPVVLRPLDNLLARHVRAQTARGRRLAEVKPPVLILDPDIYAALLS